MNFSQEHDIQIVGFIIGKMDEFLIEMELINQGNLTENGARKSKDFSPKMYVIL